MTNSFRSKNNTEGINHRIQMSLDMIGLIRINQ